MVKLKQMWCLCANDHCILHAVCMVITHQVYQSIDRPGKVTSPACVQLNRENEYFYVRPRSRLRISYLKGTIIPGHK